MTNKPRSKTSIVVRGDAARFVPGLNTNEDEYGVVLPHTLVAIGDFVHGVLLSCSGERLNFRMPMDVFRSLEMVEVNVTGTSAKEHVA